MSFTLTLPATWIIEIEVSLLQGKKCRAQTMPVLISGADVIIDLDGIVETEKKVVQLVGRLEGAITKVVNKKIEKGEIGIHP